MKTVGEEVTCGEKSFMYGLCRRLGSSNSLDRIFGGFCTNISLELDPEAIVRVNMERGKWNICPPGHFLRGIKRYNESDLLPGMQMVC